MAPVRPRNAATLILVRSGSSGPEVLMGRRPRTSRFMPGMFVFPGGALDPDDRHAGAATELDPRLGPRRPFGGIPARARALAMAAVRETAEETGFLLAAPGDVGPAAGEGYRRMRQAGLAPALDRLRYLGRAITPVSRPIRFHARFFVADAGAIRGERVANEELEEVAWIPLDRRNSVPLPVVTLFMLNLLARKDGDPERFGPDEPAPLYMWSRGRERIRMDP